jgi:predicted DNA-binding protein (MmcQ/YjbR family)
MREICLSLPDTRETLSWGKPHFRVGNFIFAGCGEVMGRPTVGFKLEKAHALALIDGKRIQRAPYVGQHGWVQMDVTGIRDWTELRSMILESYQLIAPKRTAARFGAEAGVRPAVARKGARASTPRGKGSRKGRASPP